MRIALCDDENTAILALKEYISAFFNQHGMDVALESFCCAEDFLLSTNSYDIVFMDIYLPGLNGIQAVQRGRADPRQQVVFTTTSREHAIEAFSLNAAHYLLKPLTQETVDLALERCLERLGHKVQEELPVRTSQGTVSVPMEKIVYIEVFDKLCTIHTVKNAFQTYVSLEALFERLDDSFLRVQRSYVVNMRFVESFLFDRVILSDGMEIMLSRNNRGELKTQYQRFLFDLARRGDA